MRVSILRKVWVGKDKNTSRKAAKTQRKKKIIGIFCNGLKSNATKLNRSDGTLRIIIKNYTHLVQGNLKTLRLRVFA